MQVDVTYSFAEKTSRVPQACHSTYGQMLRLHQTEATLIYDNMDSEVPGLGRRRREGHTVKVAFGPSTM